MHQVDIGGVDLNLLKLFDALLKERSVTRAGAALGLSQPAASRGLARLRKLLNDQLLVRTAKGWDLTPRAYDLSEPVAKLLEDVRLIVAPTVFEPSNASGCFTIATVDHMALLLLPKLIAKLAVLAPGMEILVPPSAGDNVELVANGEVDLAVGVFSDLPARFYCRALYEEDFVCVVRKNHPLLTQPLDLNRFLSLSHVAVIITGQGTSTIDAALALQGLTRNVVMRLPHFLAAPMIIAESNLILSLPRRLAQQMSNLIAIEILELPLTVQPFTPSLIWHGKQHDDPAHKWLRQLILDIACEVN